MKPEFYIEQYADKPDIEYAMHCETLEEAKIFLRYLHSKGRRWCSGKSYLKVDHFDEYKGDSCYFFNSGFVNGLSWLKSSKFLSKKIFVLSFKDFSWETPQDTGVDLTDTDNKRFDEFIASFSITCKTQRSR